MRARESVWRSAKKRSADRRCMLSLMTLMRVRCLTEYCAWIMAYDPASHE